MTSTILVLSCCENVKGMSATQLLNFLVIFQLCCHLFSVFKLTKKQICCSTCSLMGWCFTLWLEFVSAVSIKWSFYKVHLNCMLTFLSVLTIKLRGKKLNMYCFSLSYCLCQFVTGTGKSQFLKFSAKLSNRSVITTGLGSTSAGLTVTAVKDGGNMHAALFTA